jgi:hypothetical protein
MISVDGHDRLTKPKSDVTWSCSWVYSLVWVSLFTSLQQWVAAWKHGKAVLQLAINSSRIKSRFNYVARKRSNGQGSREGVVFEVSNIPNNQL